MKIKEWKIKQRVFSIIAIAVLAITGISAFTLYVSLNEFNSTIMATIVLTFVLISLLIIYGVYSVHKIRNTLELTISKIETASHEVILSSLELVCSSQNLVTLVNDQLAQIQRISNSVEEESSKIEINKTDKRLNSALSGNLQGDLNKQTVAIKEIADIVSALEFILKSKASNSNNEARTKEDLTFQAGKLIEALNELKIVTGSGNLDDIPSNHDGNISRLTADDFIEVPDSTYQKPDGDKIKSVNMAF